MSITVLISATGYMTITDIYNLPLLPILDFLKAEKATLSGWEYIC